MSFDTPKYKPKEVKLPSSLIELNVKDLKEETGKPIEEWDTCYQKFLISRPTFQENYFNTFSAVRFDGANDFLSFDPKINKEEFTIFIVGELLNGPILSFNEFEIKINNNKLIASFKETLLEADYCYRHFAIRKRKNQPLTLFTEQDIKVITKNPEIEPTISESKLEIGKSKNNYLNGHLCLFKYYDKDFTNSVILTELERLIKEWNFNANT